MLYFYIAIRNETPEVMLLDSDVLRMRSPLRGNRECDRSLIVFGNHYWNYYIFEKNTQHRRGLSLKFEYKLNFFHKTHKR